MRLAARLEAMITDPVYEGESMAGIIDLVRRGMIERPSNVLSAHLGAAGDKCTREDLRLTTIPVCG